MKMVHNYSKLMQTFFLWLIYLILIWFFTKCVKSVCQQYFHQDIQLNFKRRKKLSIRQCVKVMTGHFKIKWNSFYISFWSNIIKSLVSQFIIVSIFKEWEQILNFPHYNYSVFWDNCIQKLTIKSWLSTLFHEFVKDDILFCRYLIFFIK